MPGGVAGVTGVAGAGEEERREEGGPSWSGRSWPGVCGLLAGAVLVLEIGTESKR